MGINATIDTIIAIWDELPKLAASYWKVLRPQLETLLAEFAATTDTAEQKRISLAVQHVLVAAPPAVLARFDEELDLIPHGLESFSNPLNVFLEKIRREKLAETITCYTDISCPSHMWVGERRIQVSVRLTQHPQDYSASVQMLAIQRKVPILVSIDAPGFEVLGVSSHTMAISPGIDSNYCVFDLRPRVEGPTHIILNFLQAGNPAGTVSIPVEIVHQPLNTIAEQQPHLLLDPGNHRAIDPADYYLYITYERSQPSPRLLFRLISMKPNSTEDPGEDFEAILLPTSPEIYATELYQDLTVLTRRHDPLTNKLLGQERRLRPEDAEERLQQWGKHLWKTLIPERLQARYAQEREHWHGHSLLILSDEPYIPWELLWPYDPDGRWVDDVPLCLNMNISRWLRRRPQGNATEKPVSELDMRALGLIIPPDSGLAAAQQEFTFLQNLMNQRGLRDASPSEPTYVAVKRLLSQGQYTWLHVAAHGNFYSPNPNASSAIWLQDQQYLTPQSIVGDIETYIRRQRPAFVFNACEVGRQGWSITGIGGWANELICAGAGMFLAPMWNVTDRAALAFSRSLYFSLLDAKTIGEAVRQARFAARSAGNPSWLAYSLYAHPNARLVELKA
ncbi:MAG: CHAT domain-containing protein [Ktedonobacteraceae bacterium]